jgi:hypothetical protein
MSEKERQLREEEEALLFLLHFHNINCGQTSFQSNQELEEHLNDILDKINTIRKQLKEIDDDEFNG